MIQYRSWKMGVIAVLIVIFPVFCHAEESEDRDIFVPNITANAPAVQNQPQTITATLEGVSMGPKANYAIINGDIYKEGEERSGIKVAKIRKRQVDIIINNVSSTLEMVVHQGSAMTGKEYAKQAVLESDVMTTNESSEISDEEAK